MENVWYTIYSTTKLDYCNCILYIVQCQLVQWSQAVGYFFCFFILFYFKFLFLFYYSIFSIFSAAFWIYFSESSLECWSTSIYLTGISYPIFNHSGPFGVLWAHIAWYKNCVEKFKKKIKFSLLLSTTHCQSLYHTRYAILLLCLWGLLGERKSFTVYRLPSFQPR